jgi:hypothetical protein
MMPIPPEFQPVARRIIEADHLFTSGRFHESRTAARQLLGEIHEVPSPQAEQWRGELLGLIGRNALQLREFDEALEATHTALQTIHALHDATTHWFFEALRENLLTVLAAMDGGRPTDGAALPGHRELRQRIVRAQNLTDRHRFARSIEILEPLLTGLLKDAGGDGCIESEPVVEPPDARVLYLPKVLGLLGFNSFHRGELDRAKDLTERAITVSRSLDDRTGERVYAASLEWIRNKMPEGARSRDSL